MAMKDKNLKRYPQSKLWSFGMAFILIVGILAFTQAAGAALYKSHEMSPSKGPVVQSPVTAIGTARALSHDETVVNDQVKVFFIADGDDSDSNDPYPSPRPSLGGGGGPLGPGHHKSSTPEFSVPGFNNYIAKSPRHSVLLVAQKSDDGDIKPDDSKPPQPPQEGAGHH